MIDDYKDGRTYKFFSSDMSVSIFRDRLVDALGDVAKPERAIHYFLKHNHEHLNKVNEITYEQIEKIRKFEIKVEKELARRVDYWEKNPPKTADEIYNCAFDFNLFRDNPSSYFANLYLIDRMFKGPNDYVDSLKDIKSDAGKMKCLEIALDFYMQDISENMRQIDGPRICINNGPRVHYVRGENDLYPKSNPSMFRGEGRTEIDYVIDELKILEFTKELTKIPSIREWYKKVSDIEVDAIAQHYGMRTRYLDFTSNIKVALFFAATIWDNKERRFRPLTKEETREDTPNQRYGGIYIIPASLDRTVSDLNKCPYIIKIGKLPFLRPIYQSGYMMRLGETEDLNKIQFKIKYKIKLTEELSKKIYEEMNSGDSIYPKEPFADIVDLTDKIKSSNTVDEKCIDTFLTRNKCTEKKGLLLKALKEKGYKIEDTYYLTEEEIKDLEIKVRTYNEGWPKELKEMRIKEKPMFAF